LADPNQPAREVVQLMTPLAKEQEIDLALELDRSLKKFIFDPELIHRCLLNLVNNAIDACQSEAPGNQNKKITLRSRKKQGWGVEYQVVDNGSGMSPAIKKKIFHRFFSTKGSAGSGIGLMATKKIIEAHQGEIMVKSKANVGSEFVIRLPQKMKIED
jgi:signal transduction histidine kinase